MPAVLDVEGCASCLAEGPITLLRPVADDVLTGWKVGARVNSVRNNGADLLEEVDSAGVRIRSRRVRTRRDHEARRSLPQGYRRNRDRL